MQTHVGLWHRHEENNDPRDPQRPKRSWMQACGSLEKTTVGQGIERETEAHHGTEAKATVQVEQQNLLMRCSHIAAHQEWRERREASCTVSSCSCILQPRPLCTLRRFSERAKSCNLPCGMWTHRGDVAKNKTKKEQLRKTGNYYSASNQSSNSEIKSSVI